MKKAIHFLCPAMAQMLLVCITAAVLHAVTGVDVTGYSSPAGILLIAAGGLSTAIWGTVYQIRHNGKTIKSILSDFFRFRADIKGYLLATVFLLLDFIPVIAGGHMAVAWYRPFMIFPTAIPSSRCLKKSCHMYYPRSSHSYAGGYGISCSSILTAVCPQ